MAELITRMVRKSRTLLQLRLLYWKLRFRVLSFAEFEVNRLEPPLAYADEAFELVYAFSVFTHLPEKLQHDWMDELTRVLKPGGYLVLSTMPERLLPSDDEEARKRFRDGQLIVVNAAAAGGNACTAFHPYNYMRGTLARAFEILEFIPDGVGQDFWLLRKAFGSPESALIQGLRLFDAEYYLDLNPDVARAGVNPLEHFLGCGGSEGRRPHPLFDPAYYLSRNPEVAVQGLNPLIHFASVGMREGRLPCPWFDDELELPLPESAWQPGESRVERVIRTFVSERETLLATSEARMLAREIRARASAQPALSSPEALATAAPVASVIVPVFNQLKFTLWCLHAVLSGTSRSTFEIVVVDDASEDATAEILKELPEIRYVRGPANRGFVHSCNLGAQHARGQYLVFLNNDTLPLQGWLDALVDTFRDRPDAGIVGSKLIYPDGRLQEAGGIVWQNGAVWNYGRGDDRRRPEFNYLRSVDFCSGAALAVPASVFRDASGFDDAFAPAYGEDVDLALRLRERGLAVLYQPLSEVVHLEGVTAGTSTRKGVKAHQVQNLQRLFERWRLPLRAHRPEGREPHLERDRDAERRVLFMDSFTPRPDQDAGSLDAFHWMQSLGALGFQVTFIPCFDLRHAGKYTSDLQRQGTECLYGGYVESVEEFLAAHGGEFDLCIFYRFQVAEALLPAVKRFAPQAKRLLALCDLSHVRTHRQATLSGSEMGIRASYETKFRELLACAQSDALWTPSQWEKEHLIRELPQAEVFVWPLAQELRAPTKAHGERTGIGFIGGYRHAPNVDAVLFFVSEVLPHVLREEPEITFSVAGSHMPPEIAGIEHPAVRILGHAADLQAFFEQIRVFVAPIRFGSGVKGKVVASLSAGVPVVGTSLALEGMGLEPEEGALVADHPQEFAREVVRIYRSQELWNRLSRSGVQRAERDYSLAAGTRNVARAAVGLGLGTGRAQKLLGASTEGAWSPVAGMQIHVCRSQAEYLSIREGDTYRRRIELEEKLLRDADNGLVVYRAYSLPGRRSVLYRARVSVNPAGKRWAGWREELLCPITGLNNRQRAIATFAERLVASREHKVDDVYLTEQVTPLFAWMSSRFQTVHIVGSEYLGLDVPSGEIRAGIQHQDIERLGFESSAFDMIVSCDVLEHVNEPERALAEFARVLRPGGHLLFTVPFLWHSEKNRRRARAAHGSIEHLVGPCYHGNPMDPGGSLAFFDYGWELLQWVRNAGFHDVSVVCYWSDTLGHLGGMLEAFHARR